MSTGGTPTAGLVPGPGEDPVGKAAEYFEHARLQRLADARNRTRRQHLINNLVRFVKLAAFDRSHPWEKIPVAADIEVVLHYDDREPGLALIQTLNELTLEHLTKKAGVVIFLRDRMHSLAGFRTPPKTKRALRNFKEQGGHYVEIQDEWLAEVEALIELRRAVTSGELLFLDEGGQKHPVTVEHVRLFMEQFESSLANRLSEVVHQA